MNSLPPIQEARPPLYIKARNVLREYIEKQGLKSGDKLPSEHKIAQSLKISRGTVREALKILENEGVVISKRGLGTFVMEKRGGIQTGVEKLESTFNIVKQAGFDPVYREITVECLFPEESIAKKLKLGSKEKIIRVCRLLTTSKKPVVFCQDNFPEKIMDSDIKESDYGGSLMELFETRFNKTILYAKSYLHTTTAKGLVAKRMEVEENSQVLYFENNHFTFNDEPVLFSKNYFKDSFIFSLIRKR